MFFCRTGRFINQKSKGKEGIQLPAGSHHLSVCIQSCLRLFFGRSGGSLTLEAALVVPLFLFAMLAMLQFASIQNASSALLGGAQDTAKEMAVYTYIRKLGVTAGDSIPGQLLEGGISTVYAAGQIRKKSGVDSSHGSFSLLQSSVTSEEIIDLVGIYRPAHTLTVLPVQKVKSVVRARVRAWTGREGVKGSGSDGEGEEETSEKVYVAETGSVYHMDPDCTHIRLSIQTVQRSALKGLRNTSGGKYHACEKCRGGSGDEVYISPYGDRYHGTLGCSGLKRTVHTVAKDEAEDLRPCSKCAGG